MSRLFESFWVEPICLLFYSMDLCVSWWLLFFYFLLSTSSSFFSSSFHLPSSPPSSFVGFLYRTPYVPSFPSLLQFFTVKFYNFHFISFYLLLFLPFFPLFFLSLLLLYPLFFLYSVTLYFALYNTDIQRSGRKSASEDWKLMYIIGCRRPMGLLWSL